MIMLHMSSNKLLIFMKPNNKGAKNLTCCRRDHIGPQTAAYPQPQHPGQLLEPVAQVLAWQLSLPAAQRRYLF